MKRVLCVILIGISCLFSGCAKGDADNVSSSDNVESSDTSVSSDDKEELKQQPQDKKTDDNKSQKAANKTVQKKDTDKASSKSYYGTFIVNSCAGTSKVYALSEDEIKQKIGTKVSFTKDSYSVNGNSMKINGFEEEKMTDQKFQNDFRASLKNIGISKNEVTAVSVKTQGDIFAGYFLIKDNNTIIIYNDGVFFEAVKQ